MKLQASTVDPPIAGLLSANYIRTSHAVEIHWGKETSLQVSNNVNFNTSASISRYMARTSPSHGLYGSSPFEEVEVDHWLSFSIGPLQCRKEFEEALLYLDKVLGMKTFLVGRKLTIADFGVFEALFCSAQWNTQTERPVENVKRWYEFIKSLDHVKSLLASLPEDAKPKEASAQVSGGRKEEGKFVDLPGAEMGKVVVRFPPEASGYLHIGHAKAALLNQYYQEAFEGTLIMRFDDTNPAKEKVDFEKVILEDLELLQIKPDVYTHTSQYFDMMLGLCEKLIKQGKAYVDDTEPETMKLEREQRTKSKNWNNSPEQNLKLWEEMKKGSEFGQKCCVRARIDMDSPNGCMRDPTIYRCKNEPHPRTGTQYKVYPTYDFACPIVDSIEGVTHCLRTMEYHDRDDQFYWFIDALGLRKPYIWEYSRLNMMNTVLSKRKLTWFVEQKLVDGWDDPRFPTVRGVLRRGMTVEGLKQFIIAQGSSRSVVMMEWDKIWAFNKKVIDPIAPRYTAVEKKDLVRVSVSGATEEAQVVAKHPKSPEVGNKTVWTGKTVLIDAADAATLKVGENTTFINWGNLLIKKVNSMGGKIVSVEAEPNLSNKDFKKTLKITWLAETEKAPLIPCYCVYFDNIISKAVLGKDEDFKQFINPTTRVEVEMIGDPELINVKKSEIIQLQRKGFFICDSEYRPVSIHSSCHSPIILFAVPDGHTKDMPTVGPPKTLSTVAMSKKEKAQSARGKSAEKSPQDEAPPTPSSDAASINELILRQGDKIRKLKSEKAAKNLIDVEVKVLQALKSDFKCVSNLDWVPGISVPNSAPNIASKPVNEANSSDSLLAKIAEQGDKIRVLKEQKAGKESITTEVQTLLALKTQFKELTGTEWTPSMRMSAVSQPAVTQSTGNSKDALLSKIAEQGDKIRVLKEQKAGKESITAEVQTLLALKTQFKELTGTEWTPSMRMSAVTQPAVTQSTGNSKDVLLSKIAEQGDKIRVLKEQKAGKESITAEVQTLLALKTQFKELTGTEWTPSMRMSAVSQSAVSQSAVTQQAVTQCRGNDRNALLARIADQGNRVRQLKSDKAAKNITDAEVQVLLSLKKEFKAVTGEDWKVDMKPTESNTSCSVEDLLVKIAQQDEKLRSLRAASAAKNVIDSEERVIVALKEGYKMMTGKEWTAGADASVGHTDTDELARRLELQITTQGANVKALKDSKASKEVIDKAVATLLEIKSQYKLLTGNDPPGLVGRAPSKSKEKTATAPPKKVEKPKEGGGPKKQTRLGLEATKEENLPDWYSQVITKGELIEYYDVSGCYILRPWSFAIWESIQSFVDGEIKKLGVQNCYFPIFVSRAALEKEKTHIADFAPEVAWVTKSGDSELAEPIAVRPTSETGMYPAYAKWIQSYRDLPIKLNQWNNVVRWEFKHPQPFLRTREFLWQEGHSAFASYKEAEEEVFAILDIYARVYTDLLAIPVVKGRKTEKEKFAGGDFTTTVEAFVSASGRAIQGATSHHLGQNFAKMFDIVFEDPETQEKQFVFQNSWGITTRTIGVMIMIHADNQGLVLPPRVACVQVVITPCGVTASLADEDKTALLASCQDLEASLKAAGVRVRGDYRENYSPGWKFNHWELKGVPIRVELGPKDLKQGQLVAVRRDTGEKITLNRSVAVKDLVNMLEAIHQSMLGKATRELDSHKVVCTDWAQFCTHLEDKKIILAPFCGQIPCEDRIKLESARDDAEAEAGAPAMGAKSLCIPFDQPTAIKPTDRCIHSACKNKPKQYTLFGRSY